MIAHDIRSHLFGLPAAVWALDHAHPLLRETWIPTSCPIQETMKARERDELIETLKARFEKNMHRHRGIAWADVQAGLERNPDALRSLRAMEASGGEPDVISRDESGDITFCDCSAESPIGRRSLCYDQEALDSRKENKPQGSAVEMAAEMGIDLLTEQ